MNTRSIADGSTLTEFPRNYKSIKLLFVPTHIVVHILTVLLLVFLSNSKVLLIVCVQLDKNHMYYYASGADLPLITIALIWGQYFPFGVSIFVSYLCSLMNVTMVHASENVAVQYIVIVVFMLKILYLSLCHQLLIPMRPKERSL